MCRCRLHGDHAVASVGAIAGLEADVQRVVGEAVHQRRQRAVDRLLDRRLVAVVATVVEPRAGAPRRHLDAVLLAVALVRGGKAEAVVGRELARRMRTRSAL